MKHQCEDCKKTFLHPSKATELKPTDINGKIRQDTVIESTVCPYCFSLNLSEAIEPTPTPEEISNVYIYDLSSGPQQALDMLLAQGYKIQQRYAKQYFLEKPKVASAKDYIVEAQEKAKEAQQP